MANGARKDAKREDREDRKQQKLDAKNERKADKQAAKTDRVNARQDARVATADQRAESTKALAGALGDGLETAGDLAGAYLGLAGEGLKGGGIDAADLPDKKLPATTPPTDPIAWAKSNPVPVLAALAGAALGAKKLGWF